MSTDSFSAFDDSGKQYTVYVQRSYKTGQYLDGTSYRTEGLRSYRLANGQPLHKIDEETFQIVATGTVIKIKQA